MGSDLRFPLTGREVGSQGTRAGVSSNTGRGRCGEVVTPLPACGSGQLGTGPHTCPSVLSKITAQHVSYLKSSHLAEMKRGHTSQRPRGAGEGKSTTCQRHPSTWTGAREGTGVARSPGPSAERRSEQDAQGQGPRPRGARQRGRRARSPRRHPRVTRCAPPRPLCFSPVTLTRVWPSGPCASRRLTGWKRSFWSPCCRESC